MKNLTGKITHVVANCKLVVALYSCSGNTNTSNYTRCEDSLAMYTKNTNDTANRSAANDSAGVNSEMNGAGSVNTESGRNMHRPGSNSNVNAEMANEPTGPMTLHVTSAAFANNGVIPVKYTCDGQGATLPLQVTNMPPGTKSYTLIVHDYNATPEGGVTYWIIWNLDTTGVVPEDFRNDHESMNISKQYGYTPVCAKSGDHRYHFIFYALDTKLVIGKNTTKASIERVMKGHILGKGEIVGIYNKRLE